MTRTTFVLLALLAAIPLSGARGEATAGPIYECRMTGILTAYSSDFLTRAIADAAKGNAQMLLVTLDTPGGLLEPSKLMVQSILNAPMPVVVYVSPAGASASSAGTFLTIAAHVAAMAPGTNIGAAHPVSVVPTGENDNVKHMMEKVTNDTVSYVKSIASYRNRDAVPIEKTVRESVSYTAKEALDKKIVDLLAEDRSALLAAVDGRTVTLAGGRQVILKTKNAAVVALERTARERLFNVVADPDIAYLLLILGIIGIVFEITHPGTALPGVAGVVSMGCALIAFKALPLSYTGLLMVLFGIAFLVVEALSPTHGVLGTGGLACLAIGSYLLFDAPAGMRSWEYIVSVVGTAAFVFLFLMSRVVADLRRPVVSGREGMIGQQGVAREDFQGEGTIAVEGEIWKALNESQHKIVAGDRVRILSIEDGRLRVTRID
ncbi:MAG: nodulation protein NfeD [Candidatus Wallbacteria bacterium]|nr:nodulation protein NfeD [Candidatus Wallbacteria bacterium]